MLTRDKAFAPLNITGATSRASDNEWHPVLPVPTDAPQLSMGIINRCCPEGYAFTARWCYLNAAGQLLGYVVRYDRPANGSPAAKQVKPFTFCEGPGGKRKWRCKGFSEPRPLYGLDRLAARPDAPVLVVEGEKTADAATIRFEDYVVVTSPNGADAARQAEWSPLKGRRVVIWPDADEPGLKYADTVADLLQDIAVSTHVVAIPPSLPQGWDLADLLPADVKDDDIAEWLEAAKPAGQVAADGPIPLFPALPPAESFPVNALAPVLSGAAASIARKVQVPEAIAAQSVLAVASLAAQVHADVLLPYGQKRPLSLFFVTVAASGDRKSTADNEALWPIRKYEQALKEEYDSELQSWMFAHAAWRGEKKKIENDRKLDLKGRQAALAKLGSEPERPLHPFLTAPDPTIEGLQRAWVSAPAGLGIFTAEGGLFVGGHSMSQDNRLRTAAGYSEMWDGQPIKRIRSLDGVSVLHGRRLSMHLMVQHEAAAQFLADPTLRDQGLLSRVLVAAPQSIAGTRLYRETAADDDAAIHAYGARILSILEAPWPLAKGSRNELEPRVLTITEDAAALWRAFYNHIERQCGPAKALRPVQDFAAKIAEHAARIAGVLTIVEDFRATTIGVEAMRSALSLADWYMNEAIRLQQAARTDPKLLAAQKMLDWLRKRDKDVIGFQEIIQFGPSPLRTKKAADAALAVLKDHGWITEVCERPRKIRLVRGA
jgi:hypothetical protein